MQDQHYERTIERKAVADITRNLPRAARGHRLIPAQRRAIRSIEACAHEMLSGKRRWGDVPAARNSWLRCLLADLEDVPASEASADPAVHLRLAYAALLAMMVHCGDDRRFARAAAQANGSLWAVCLCGGGDFSSVQRAAAPEAFARAEAMLALIGDGTDED